jgi:hypothetical protein
MSILSLERIAKNLILILTVLSFATAPAFSASERLKGIAPADRYFGRLKMSYLGINNTFKDAAVAAGNFTTDLGIISPNRSRAIMRAKTPRPRSPSITGNTSPQAARRKLRVSGA